MEDRSSVVMGPCGAATHLAAWRPDYEVGGGCRQNDKTWNEKSRTLYVEWETKIGEKNKKTKQEGC